ncbi:zinc finger and SCAN domain-containing protein 10 [Drosophila novamexicana]|uniref:zinc finger and SCAN domain-containing protein 10 n=1 Tax=Drosophila novamexicana TaxID=47314 RepID=UPI0011E5C626|nr:zinc finger and SCAN domain-containing protein 10 [Drosophila novamexicana]
MYRSDQHSVNRSGEYRFIDTITANLVFNSTKQKRAMKPKCILPKHSKIKTKGSLVANATNNRKPENGRVYYCRSCLVAFPRFLVCKAHEQLCDTRIARLHICKYCLTLYGDEQLRQRHIQRKHMDGRYMCLQCGTFGKRYSSSIFLYKHVVSWHGEHSLFYCAMCADNCNDAKAFSCMSDLIAHAESDHSLQGDGSVVDETEDLEMLEENIDELLPTVDWDDDLTFGWPMDLDKESCIADPKPKPSAYVCPLCANGYTGSISLLKHIEKSHNRNPLDCIFCGKSHKNREAIRAHLQRQHVLLRAHICSVCQADFTTADHLLKHMRSKHLERAHVCPECGKSFAQISHLTEHMLSERGHIKHTCNLCNTQFFRSIDLSRHIQLKHSTNL